MVVSRKILLGILGGVLSVVAVIVIFTRYISPMMDHSSIRSHYIGQEFRNIKSLSPDDIEGLLDGSGTPFGGMAKPGELNGYPGPRHVLDAFASGEFDLSDEQNQKIQTLYEEMRSKAIDLGTQIINLEKEIDESFKGNVITKEFLQEKVRKSARLYGELRIVHLQYHLFMVEVLTPEQITQYNELRGYASENPCDNIPDGHDSDLWKAHNNC